MFKEKFVKALGGLAMVLGEVLSRERILAYYEIMSGYDESAVLMAIDQAGITCKFFPKPSELIELITGGKGGGQDPVVAWQVVLKAMEDIGSYNNVEFADGAIAGAIEALGGWQDLCQMTYEILTLQRVPAKFGALYAEAVRHGRHQEPGRLYGALDTQNSANGFAAEFPFIRAKTMAEIQSAAQSRGRLPAPKLRRALPEVDEAWLRTEGPAALNAITGGGSGKLSAAKRLN